jgi:hypothetical protein
MEWRLKFALLLILSLPAFVGYPVVLFDAELIAGLTYGWICYFFIANTAILIINGGRYYANILAVTALVTIPVVFVGGFISYLIFLLGFGYTAGQIDYSPHYVSICITMLTVIPLALCLISIIPFQRFEQKLLQNKSGISKFEKSMIMFLRVFNHIVYFVIPNILETIREERQNKRQMQNGMRAQSDSSKKPKFRNLSVEWSLLIKNMIQLGVDSICASIQYIPLWAVEISQLPNKERNRKRR